MLLHAAEDLPISAVQDAKVDLLGNVLNGDGLHCGAQEVQAHAVQTLLQKKLKFNQRERKELEGKKGEKNGVQIPTTLHITP